MAILINKLMNIVVSNSPNIPSGPEAGLASAGTYTPDVVNRWFFPTVGGEGGAIYLDHNGTRWTLYSSYGPTVDQSDPCDVSVQPWEAVWPSPMVVALESTCDPRFDMHAHGDECGEDRFRRLRLLGYI